MARYNPLRELILARTREFFREPEAIFWVYVFPIVLMTTLGAAFRGGPAEELRVAVMEGPRAAEIKTALDGREGFVAQILSGTEAQSLYTSGKFDLIVRTGEGAPAYILDPARSNAEWARLKVDGALQTAGGRKDVFTPSQELITQPGSRYIDWLIPGIMGMNIMGGGLWGLGFVTVDLRMRKLLKRFVATPMRRSDFLLALMGSRLLFLIPEISVILGVGHFAFGLEVRGSLLAVVTLIIIGAATFAGLGLLVACRTDKIETVSGILNLVMVPMWLVSGVFFPASRFPEALQPYVQALPLTQLNSALRAVILDGEPLVSQWLPILILTLFGSVSFSAALRWFKWQ